MAENSPTKHRTAKGLLKAINTDELKILASMFDPLDPVTGRNRNGALSSTVKIVQLSIRREITTNCALEIREHFRGYWSAKARN